MNLTLFQHKVSSYAKEGTPFFFLIDFELKQPAVVKLDETVKHNVLYNLNGKTNYINGHTDMGPFNISGVPIDKSVFTDKFNNVVHHIKKGDSFLLNLTFPSQLKTEMSLKDIFKVSKAPYKLLFGDKFVVFSPECFIKITGNTISTFPMKGTIDASIENAESLLLNNDKEIREHNTIVDLMRNDLSTVARSVEVKKFRYVDKIKTNRGSILQTSSEISGTLPTNWKKSLGEILIKLLPAGSVSGAPKKKTVEIISKNEVSPRGYYTGIFGVFDGKNLDSGVAIRFIEKKDGTLYFRSGGGITALSSLEDEYSEIKQKIYVPTV